MNDYTEKIGEHLNDILEKHIDANKGFEKAVDNTKNSMLAGYFKSKAAERSGFITDLRAELAHYGGKFKESGSVAASVHRGWMDVKALFSSDDDESMLEEAIRGEKAALKEYDEALEPGELPETTAILLRKQRDGINAGLQKIKSLEDLH